MRKYPAIEWRINGDCYYSFINGDFIKGYWYYDAAKFEREPVTPMEALEKIIALHKQGDFCNAFGSIDDLLYAIEMKYVLKQDVAMYFSRLGYTAFSFPIKSLSEVDTRVSYSKKFFWKEQIVFSFLQFDDHNVKYFHTPIDGDIAKYSVIVESINSTGWVMLWWKKID